MPTQSGADFSTERILTPKRIFRISFPFHETRGKDGKKSWNTHYVPIPCYAAFFYEISLWSTSKSEHVWVFERVSQWFLSFFLSSFGKWVYCALSSPWTEKRKVSSKDNTSFSVHAVNFLRSFRVKRNVNYPLRAYNIHTDTKRKPIHFRVQLGEKSVLVFLTFFLPSHFSFLLADCFLRRPWSAMHTSPRGGGRRRRSRWRRLRLKAPEKSVYVRMDLFPTRNGRKSVN